MPPRKFYAVRIPGQASAIYGTWGECEKKVKGVSGAVFKSFLSREAAQAFLDGAPAQVSAQAAPGEIHVYVDGSFTPAKPHAGWGFVAVRDGLEIHRSCGRTQGAALSRNIDGELEASLQAIAWLQKQQFAGVIVHDYEGIARWALGDWKATSEIAKRYVAAVAGRLHNIRFRKVAGHSGDPWNDVADELAKQGLDVRLSPSERAVV